MKNVRLMYQWDENPLLPMLVFVCAGVLTAKTFPVYSWLLYSGCFLVLCGFILCIRVLSVRLFGWIGIFRTLIGWILYFWVGSCLAYFQREEKIAEIIRTFSCVVMESYGVQEGGKLRCLAYVDKGKQSNQWIPVNERVLLQFANQETDFQNGDRLLVSRELAPIEKPGIPGQFDAQAFYGRQGIHYQVFVQQGQFKQLFPSKPMFLRSVSQSARKFLEITLAKHLPTAEDGYMVSALLLGIRRKIDPELKAAYSAAGVTHILAVSGMHVGLIFGCLVFAFGWIRQWKSGAWLFSIVIIGLLWFYALVTGLSPSVLRAVTVFSVMQLNDLFKKPPLAVNGLCFATLILLCADTNLVYDVGYQLSFAAVYGIISFEKSIRNWWRPGNFLTVKIWEGISITLAATVATFPVIIYYFHQFPVYFLLANVVAVPVSNALIYAGIALVISSPIPFLAKGIGWIIHWTIAFLNGFVVFIQGLPFSSIGDVYIHWFPLILIFAALLFLNLWFRYGWFQFLKSSLFILLFAAITISFQNQILWNSGQESFVIRTKKEWMLGEMNGRTATLNILAASKAKEQASFEVKALKEGFHVLHVNTKADSGRTISVDKRHPERKTVMVVKNRKRYLFLGNYLNRKAGGEKMAVEAMVVLGGGYKTIENALEVFTPKEIWVDWKESQVSKWKKDHPESIPTIINYRNQRFRVI